MYNRQLINKLYKRIDEIRRNSPINFYFLDHYNTNICLDDEFRKSVRFLPQCNVIEYFDNRSHTILNSEGLQFVNI